MALKKVLNDVFSCFNTSSVRYCLLRDYETDNMINNADDIDLSVASADRVRTMEILRKQGWFTPQINPNTYSHQQFFKWFEDKVYKLDILWDLYFDNGHYMLKDINVLYQSAERHPTNIAKIPSNQIGLKILLLHVLFDKKTLSKKNRIQLNRLLSLCVNQDGVSTELGIEIASKLLLEKSIDSNSIETYRKIFLEKNVLVKKNNFMWKIKQKLIMKYWIKKTKQTRIALVGVDGTGKSSTVENLNSYYGKHIFIQYMGFKEYKTSFANKWAGKDRKHISLPYFNTLLYMISTYFEMRYRYKKAIQSGKELIVFDRYVWEANDNAWDSVSGVVSKVLFKALFPKPDGIVYLFCPTDTSLQRKDDIENKEIFITMKERTDKIYMNMHGVLVVDTHINDKEQVRNSIIEYVCKVSEAKLR